MARNKVCFIQSWNPHGSRRQNELERAKARSHAAFVAAQRTKRAKLSQRMSRPSLLAPARATPQHQPDYRIEYNDELSDSAHLSSIEQGFDSRKSRDRKEPKEHLFSDSRRRPFGRIILGHRQKSLILSDHNGLRIDPFHCIRESKDRGVAEVLDFCKSHHKTGSSSLLMQYSPFRCAVPSPNV